MTQSVDQPGRPLADLSPKAGLRVGMSELAADLLSVAAPMIATYADDLDADGGRITQAAMVVEYAQHLLTLTVAYYRLSGMTWDAIGKRLGGISRQAAEQRYGGQVARYERILLYLWLLGPDAPRGDGAAPGDPDHAVAAEDLLLLHLLRAEDVELQSVADIHDRARRETPIPTGLLDPAGMAAVLDRSMLPASENNGQDTRPVSAHLPRMEPAETIRLLQATIRQFPRLRTDLDGDQFQTFHVAYARRAAEYCELTLAQSWGESTTWKVHVVLDEVDAARHYLGAVNAGQDPDPDDTTSPT